MSRSPAVSPSVRQAGALPVMVHTFPTQHTDRNQLHTLKSIIGITSHSLQQSRSILLHDCTELIELQGGDAAAGIYMYIYGIVYLN